MKNMFKDAAVFKQNLNDWKLGAATTTAGMFEGAAAFNAPVNAWDVSKVADISKMFSAASPSTSTSAPGTSALSKVVGTRSTRRSTRRA